MSQNLSKIIGSVFVVALIISNTNVQSAKIESSSSAIAAISSQSSISSTASSLSAKNSSTAESSSSTSSQNSTQSTPSPDKPTKVKVIKSETGKDEIDTESEIEIKESDKKRYKDCKSKNLTIRSKRNQNKPTPCRKQPKEVGHNITDEAYLIIIDALQDRQDQSSGKDMNKELPIEDFLKDLTLQKDCNLSSISTSVSSDSSQIGCSSTSASSSSSLSSDSSQNSSNVSTPTSSSQISSLSSSVSNVSIQSELIKNSSVSTSSILESSPILPYDSKNSSISNISSQSAKSTTSFLDNLFSFGTIRTEAINNAVGSKVDGFKIPFKSGQKVVTQRIINDERTHANHNALDFVSVNNTLVTENKDVVAAKAGVVDYKALDTTSLGYHVVIRQYDGNYTIYGHFSQITKNIGDNVNQGEKIGVQGDTAAYDPRFDNSHVHFEVFKSGIINHPNCTNGFNYNNCYTTGFVNDTYKVIPQFDECFANRGGVDESRCYGYYQGIWQNTGYPAISQSRDSGQSYTANPPFNPYNGMIRSSSNSNFVFDVANNDPTIRHLLSYGETMVV